MSHSTELAAPAAMQPPSGYFTQEASVDTVNARMGPETSPRLHQIMASLVRHLHAFAKDVVLRQEEWDFAIDFLTRTGQICTTERQEFILLSDTLGLTMLVDAISHPRPAGATQSTVLGPFYVADAPIRAMGSSISLDGKGKAVCSRAASLTWMAIRSKAPASMSGRTMTRASTMSSSPTSSPGGTTGALLTGTDGAYAYRGIKPVSYPIPDDGPVGQMLAALGRHPYRPAHMHFIITAPGYQKLVTHTFAQGDRYLSSDSVFGVKDSLIAQYEKVNTPEEQWRSQFDFVLVPERERHA
jgi:catechol 1,2-dioxygenase